MKRFTKKIGVPIIIQGSKSSYALAHDLRNGVPAANSSLQTIYHSHFLEHLTNDEGASFLRDCYQCLADGGTMRFALPDFELWCKKYVSKESNFFDWYKNAYLGEWWWQTHELACWSKNAGVPRFFFDCWLALLGNRDAM